MDLNDDVLDLDAPHEPSPPSRKLKRLKKSKPTHSSPQTLFSDHPSPPQSQSPEIHNSSTPANSPQLNSPDHSSPPQSQSPEINDSTAPIHSPQLNISEHSSPDNSETLRAHEPSEGEDEVLGLGFEGLGAKRALEFGDENGDFESEQVGDEAEETSETSETSDTKRKNKKAKGDDGFGEIPERMTQKERRARFEELRAENQRLLRETSNAAFKPAPIVQKPISSLLEKIRRRKLEVSKKFTSASEPVEESSNVRELDVDSDQEDLIVEGDHGSILKHVGSKENAVQHVGENDSLDVLGNDGSNEAEDQLTRGNSSPHLTLNGENKPTFRPPIDDSQGLFTQLPTNDTNDEPSDEQLSSPLEETFAPSVLAMNLKFDSAPLDDELSDEEDNDKENIQPASHGLADPSTLPSGDPVKAFLEEEAEEEDDSNNDLNRFQDDEEDDDEDAEELNAMIATDYKERPVDAEMRYELHQKWLEQQDTAGTDNLFQRLKYGSVLKEAGLLDEEEDEDGEEDHDNEHDSDDDASENLAPKTIVKLNMKKAKQMLPQMFSDKDDIYISSDEETEEEVVVQRSTRIEEHKTTLISPAEDESSRDIFGRIKKLNDLPDTRKKPKASAFLDTLLTVHNKRSSFKSTFLGRGSNASLPSLQRRTSNKARSFIFERDDSNSRNATSVTEGPSEMMQREIQPKRNTVSKVSYSQPTSSSQIRKAATETETHTSLFDVLQRSAMRSDDSNIDHRSQDTQAQSIFLAFKLDKSINNERRA